MPWLLTDRGDILRATQRFLGSSPCCSDTGEQGRSVLQLAADMIYALLNLSDSDLSEIGRALRAQRIEPPFTTVALERLVGPRSPDALAGLDQLSSQQFSPEQMATIADLVCRARSQKSVAEDLFDLVVTGPEAPGITSRDTSVVVREMFTKAENTILLAGYSVYQGQKVFQSLAERMVARPDMKVQFFLD